MQFGTLQITERACYTRPATEAPQTTSFVEVDEIDADKKYKRIFSGWMFAASPGLHGIEHPIYDIWLTDCTGGRWRSWGERRPRRSRRLPPPSQRQKHPSPCARSDEAAAQGSAKAKSIRRPRWSPWARRRLRTSAMQMRRRWTRPIEVAPPPGFIPAPPGNQHPPAQEY